MKTISKTKEITNSNTLIRYLKVPIQILSFAVEIYVKSLAASGANIGYGNTMGCPTPQMPSFPRTFGVDPSNGKFRTVDEDLPELIKLSSTRKTTAINGGEPTNRGPNKVVVFGTIDEEREVDGEEDSDVTVGLLRPHHNQVYARSTTKVYPVVLKSKVV